MDPILECSGESEDGHSIEDVPDVSVQTPRVMVPNFSKGKTRRLRRTSAPAIYGEDSEPLLWDRSFHRRVSISVPAEAEDIVPNKEVTAESLGLKPYKTRFYMLLVVMIVNTCSNGLMAMIAPIAHSTEQVYGFDDGEIALLTNWPNIGFLVGFIFLMWLTTSKGLRAVTSLVVILQFIGSGIRCVVAIDRHLAKWAFHLGSFFIGLGAPYPCISPALLSSVWFPTNERTTATAVASTGSMLGAAAVALAGPYLITEDTDIHNGTNCSSHSGKLDRCANETELIRKHQFHEYCIYLFIQSGIVFLALLLVLIYFPRKPPTPPTVSASLDRSDFKSGLIALLRMKDFLLLCYATAGLYGLYIAWLGLLDVNLNKLGISQKIVGWLLAVSMFSGVISAFFMGRVADYMRSKHKCLLIMVTTIGVLSTAWFSLQAYGYLHPYEATVYASIILIGISANGTVPLGYEALLEMTHPINEGVTLGTQAIFLNLNALIFLLLPMIPGVGSEWLNWCLLGMFVLAIPLLIMYKQRYNRLLLDDLSNTDESHFESNDAGNF